MILSLRRALAALLLRRSARLAAAHRHVAAVMPARRAVMALEPSGAVDDPAASAAARLDLSERLLRTGFFAEAEGVARDVARLPGVPWDLVRRLVDRAAEAAARGGDASRAAAYRARLLSEAPADVATADVLGMRLALLKSQLRGSAPSQALPQLRALVAEVEAEPSAPAPLRVASGLLLSEALSSVSPAEARAEAVRVDALAAAHGGVLHVRSGTRLLEVDAAAGAPDLLPRVDVLLASASRLLGRRSPDVLRLRGLRVDALLASGRASDAAVELADLSDAVVSSVGRRDPEFLGVLRRSSVVLAALGRDDEALAAAQESAAAHLAVRGPYARSTFAARARLLSLSASDPEAAARLAESAAAAGLPPEFVASLRPAAA